MFASHWSLNRTGDNGLSSGESEPNGHRDSLMTDYGLSIHRISMRDWGLMRALLVIGTSGKRLWCFEFCFT